MLTGVLEQAGAHFAPRACHAVGRADQAFTLGVFADGDEQVARGLFDACGIVGHSCSSSTPAAPLPRFEDLLREEYLWSEEYDEEADELRYEEEDVFPDALFYSFYYYTWQAVLAEREEIEAARTPALEAKLSKVLEAL